MIYKVKEFKPGTAVTAYQPLPESLEYLEQLVLRQSLPRLSPHTVWVEVRVAITEYIESPMEDPS